MYLDHFGLIADPFSLTPRLDFLYLSEAFEESIAHLAYGLENGEAITLITGVMGTGKTLVLHSFLSHLDPQTCATAMVNTTQVDYLELLKLILDDLGVDYPMGADRADLLRLCKRLVEEANRKRKKILVIVDEAQNLDWRFLEGLRLLTNLDQRNGQGLQLVLVGQPDLERKINQPDLAQLRQRIRVHYRLENLNRKELGEYVRHRMKVAGCEREIFKPAALDKIFRLSGGVPRLVNILAGEALLTAYLAESQEVRAEHVEVTEAGPMPGIVTAPAQAAERRVVEKMVQLHFKESSPPPGSDRPARPAARPPAAVAPRPAPPPPPAAPPPPRPEPSPTPSPPPQHTVPAGAGEKKPETQLPPAVAPVPNAQEHGPIHRGPRLVDVPTGEWVPTLARHQRSGGRGRTVLLVAAIVVVLVAAAWIFLGPRLPERFGGRRAAPVVTSIPNTDLPATPPTTATATAPTSGEREPTADDHAVQGAGNGATGTTPSPTTAERQPVQTTPPGQTAAGPSGTGARQRLAERPAEATTPVEPSGRSAGTPAAGSGLGQEPLRPDTEGYAVHVSSFRDSARAFATCDSLRAQGLPAFCREATIQGHRWFRVFAGPYMAHDAASSAVQRLRSLGWESAFQIMKLSDVG